MTRKELEKMFNENFDLWITVLENNQWQYEINNQQEVKDFIFETIIPEVLNSLLSVNGNLKNRTQRDYDFAWESQRYYDKAQIDAYENIKQKAKENFWITL